MDKTIILGCLSIGVIVAGANLNSTALTMLGAGINGVCLAA